MESLKELMQFAAAVNAVFTVEAMLISTICMMFRLLGMLDLWDVIDDTLRVERGEEDEIRFIYSS